MKKIFLSFFAIVMLAISCKKDKNEGPPAITVENIAGNYKVSAFNFKEGSVTIDLLSQWDTCAKDDIITLNKDKSYVWPDGGMKCNPAADQNGNWDLQGTTKFLWDGDPYDLNSYDGKILQISQSGIDTFPQLLNSGQPFTLTYTFKKQ